MLKTRIIPVVLLNGYAVIKTINFETRRNLGNPITVARVYNSRNVDELILLDIDASRQDRAFDGFTVEEISKECFMPLTIGGGLKSLEDIEKILSKGADKVIINTAALTDPSFVEKACQNFGSQCIVVSIDAQKVNDEYRVFNPKLEEIKLVKDHVREVEDLGAGEIFINSVDTDGMMQGVDASLLAMVNAATTVPVIGCGGIEKPSDGVAMAKAGCSGIAAASIFHFTGFTPNDIKDALAAENFPVRIDPTLAAKQIATGTNNLRDSKPLTTDTV